MCDFEPNELITVNEEGVSVLDSVVSAQIALIEKTLKEYEEKEKVVRDAILKEMEKKGIIKLETPLMTISYKASYDKETFDSKAFKKDNPDLYDNYIKMSTTKSSITIKLKEEANEPQEQ